MRVGTIAFTTNQGIAHLARDFHAHGVIDRVFTVDHPHYRNHPERYPGGYAAATAEAFLDGLDVLLLFETGLDWAVVREAKRRGVKLAVCPMYEYTPKPFPVPVDLYLCPSLLDLQVYSDCRSTFLPVPVEKPWRLRRAAATFVHNAGHGQYQYGKGTPELLEAMRHVKSPARLLVRGQPDDAKIPRLFGRHKGAQRVEFVMADVPEDQLYAEGEVFVFPQRYNGLSLPLQEAWASGMMVMTTDRFPENTWLPKAPLIPVSRYEKCTIATTFDRAVIDPLAIAAKIDEWYGQDVSEYSRQGREWAEANSWAALKPKYLALLESLL